jgi:hypothetical protein
MGDFATVSKTLGAVKPETRSIAQEIFNAAAAAGHEIWAMWGYDGNAGNPEHHSALALDLMVRNPAAGNWIRNYVWANRARLRLRHVIWSQRITSTVTQPGVVRKMADRGSPTNNHLDHNHILLFPGAYQPPNGGNTTTPPVVGTKSIHQLSDEVIAGFWGDGDDRRRRLTAEGYDYDAVQAVVTQKLRPTIPPPPPRKSVVQLATEVIDQQWGNGDDRRRRLTDAGYDYNAVQAEVNRRLKGTGKSISQLATEVMRGDWGNGDERVRRLRNQGYDPVAVQKEVNRRS